MPATEPSHLYGLPLERFTDERNALAKRLRQDGRREEGAEVAKLRKPSVAAWAVNQLVRTQKRDVDALLAAGDALQKAQDDVLGGRADAGALRRAADAERAALDALTAAARGLLSSEGHELAPAKLEQVSETLHAAAIDEQARNHYAALYARPHAMHDAFEQFAAFTQDAKDNAVLSQTKLSMPVLAIGGEKAFGAYPGAFMRAVATDVREVVIPKTGHWLLDENPDVTVPLVRDFIDGR